MELQYISCVPFVGCYFAFSQASLKAKRINQPIEEVWLYKRILFLYILNKLTDCVVSFCEFYSEFLDVWADVYFF